MLTGSSGTNSLAEASIPIGKTVGYMDGDAEASGVVESVTNKMKINTF